MTLKIKDLIHDVAYYLNRYYPENEITNLDSGIYLALTNFLAGNYYYIENIKNSNILQSRVLDNIQRCQIKCNTLQTYLKRSIAFNKNIQVGE